MKITIERLPSKKGWVAFPASAGRPSHGVTKAAKTKREHVVEAPTRDAAIQGVLKSVGFKPHRV